MTWKSNNNFIQLMLLKDNSTMDKTGGQIVSYGILYLNPSSHQCQPSHKKYIGVLRPHNRHKIESLAVTLLLMT